MQMSVMNNIKRTFTEILYLIGFKLNVASVQSILKIFSVFNYSKTWPVTLKFQDKRYLDISECTSSSPGIITCTYSSLLDCTVPELCPIRKMTDRSIDPFYDVWFGYPIYGRLNNGKRIMECAMLLETELQFCCSNTSRGISKSIWCCWKPVQT